MVVVVCLRPCQSLHSILLHRPYIVFFVAKVGPRMRLLVLQVSGYPLHCVGLFLKNPSDLPFVFIHRIDLGGRCCPNYSCSRWLDSSETRVRLRLLLGLLQNAAHLLIIKTLLFVKLHIGTRSRLLM